jgi:hypothetical protein
VERATVIAETIEQLVGHWSTVSSESVGDVIADIKHIGVVARQVAANGGLPDGVWSCPACQESPECDSGCPFAPLARAANRPDDAPPVPGRTVRLDQNSQDLRENLVPFAVVSAGPGGIGAGWIFLVDAPTTVRFPEQVSEWIELFMAEAAELDLFTLDPVCLPAPASLPDGSYRFGEDAIRRALAPVPPSGPWVPAIEEGRKTNIRKSLIEGGRSGFSWDRDVFIAGLQVAHPQEGCVREHGCGSF